MGKYEIGMRLMMAFGWLEDLDDFCPKQPP